MGRELALAHIRLESPPRIGHTEYSLEYHRGWLSRRLGLPSEEPGFLGKAYDSVGMDLVWQTDDGIVDWAAAGRVTDMGHAAWAADGADQREPETSPFRGEHDVWAFDAVAEYGMPDFDAQVAAYEELTRKARLRFPHQLATGGYYRTIVSGAIAVFGWENLLLAASDPAKMEKVFDGFFRRTLFHMEAWARTGVEVVIQHDDFVWESGPFMNLDIYRKVLIPRYRELWKPLRDAGKKVLFCSDGDFIDFAEDVIEAGADGLIFEPSNFEFLAKNFSRDVCLVGSLVDCRDLSYGDWKKVRTDIDRTLAAFSDAKGAVFAVGNHLAPDIKGDMLDRYFEYLLPRLEKTGPRAEGRGPMENRRS